MEHFAKTYQTVTEGSSGKKQLFPGKMYVSPVNLGKERRSLGTEKDSPGA